MGLRTGHCRMSRGDIRQPGRRHPSPAHPEALGCSSGSPPTTQGPGERPGSRRSAHPGTGRGAEPGPEQGAGRGGGEVGEWYYPEAEGSNYITNKPGAQAVN